MRVFVSYSHKQTAWVHDRLVPVLEAGGAEVLIDTKLFKAGRTIVGQMDATQDQAERHALCLSADYHASPMCRHELRHAVATDPTFDHGQVLPLRLDDAPLPAEIAAPNPIWIDFRDIAYPKPWRILLDGCGADLGVAATAWLAARDAVTHELNGGNSVNLVVLGKGIAGEELVHGLPAARLPGLAVVDLIDPGTITRNGLCLRILQALGMSVAGLAKKPHDLADFGAHLRQLGRPARVALVNFDIAVTPKDYDANFYAALRFLVTERRSLQLLVHSRRPFGTLLPRDNPLSTVDLKTVELR